VWDGATERESSELLKLGAGISGLLLSHVEIVGCMGVVGGMGELEKEDWGLGESELGAFRAEAAHDTRAEKGIEEVSETSGG
jgi:hypothetical protein